MYLASFCSCAVVLYNRYLNPQYLSAAPKEGVTNLLGRDGYDGVPTLVAKAHVFIHTSGYVWNDKASL